MDAAKEEIARLRNSEGELQARATRAESLCVGRAQALAAKEQARSTSLERELADARAAIQVERKLPGKWTILPVRRRATAFPRSMRSPRSGPEQPRSKPKYCKAAQSSTSCALT